MENVPSFLTRKSNTTVNLVTHRHMETDISVLESRNLLVMRVSDGCIQ